MLSLANKVSQHIEQKNDADQMVQARLDSMDTTFMHRLSQQTEHQAALKATMDSATASMKTR